MGVGRTEPQQVRPHGPDSTRPRGELAVGSTQGRAAVGPAPRGQHRPLALSTALAAGVALLCSMEVSRPFPADPNDGGRGGISCLYSAHQAQVQRQGVLSTGILPWGPTFFHSLLEREEAGRGPGGPRVMAGVTEPPGTAQLQGSDLCLSLLSPVNGFMGFSSPLFPSLPRKPVFATKAQDVSKPLSNHQGGRSEHRDTPQRKQDPSRPSLGDSRRGSTVATPPNWGIRGRAQS